MGSEANKAKGAGAVSGWPCYAWSRSTLCAALVAMPVLGFTLQLWMAATFRLNDPYINRVREQVCKPENMQTVEFLRKQGFIHVPSFVPPQDLEALQKKIRNISSNVRYVCGASDIQPRECMNYDQELFEAYPKFMRKIQLLFEKWKADGHVEALQLNRWGGLEVKGSEFIAINNWPFPFNLMKGSWEFEMGPTISKSLPRIVSLIKGWVTIWTGFPLYTGYHGWHADGPDPHGGRYHKIFTMVWKEGSKYSKEHSNLMLIPYQMQMVAAKSPLFLKYADAIEFYSRISSATMGNVMDELACTVKMDPGDIIFFSENIQHRTQDMQVSRFAIIFDVQ